MDREALTTLRGRLDMNSFFWRVMQNKDLASYDVLLKMIMREIINEELRYQQNGEWGKPRPLHFHKYKKKEVQPLT